MARPALVVDAIPIEDAICGVAVLLNLDEQIAAADGVKTSRREEHGVAGFDANRVNTVCDSPLFDRVSELFPRQGGTQAEVKFRIGIRGRDIPEFCFRFAT